MIDALKDDALIKKVGGQFRLTGLVQRRMKELVDGARPLVESEGKTMIEIVVAEILEDKITVDYDKSQGLRKETATTGEPADQPIESPD